MKERPILMHAPSIQGILAGRKTQTRRIVKGVQPDNSLVVKKATRSQSGLTTHVLEAAALCPYGVPGDRLWVREAFYLDNIYWLSGRLPSARPSNLATNQIYYRADGECCAQIPECSCAEIGKPKWRSSLFMPRWASRLTLEITGVRVERVQDISEVDAKAEGIELHPEIASGVPGAYRDFFRHLWDDTNGNGAWERNDWCWVLELKRVEFPK